MAERETFLAQVLKDALEDPVTDWATIEGLRWFLPGLEDGTDEPGPHGGANVHATVTLTEEPRELAGQARTFELSPQTIAKGYDVLMKNTELAYVPAGLRDRLMRARALNDPTLFVEDGLDQDTLVQLGLFGRVIF